MDDYLSYDEYLDGYVVTGFTGDQNVTTVTIPATHLNKTVYGVRGVYTSEGTYSSIFGSEYDGNITTITIESGVSFVGIGAFANCDNLSSVVLPNSIQYIDNGAFYNCVSLPSVNIPSSVTTIGDFAFGNCAGLVSVTLPTTPITISRFAFTGCTGLSNYSAMALSRYGISPSVATPKLVGTDALAVFLDKLKDLFVVVNGDEYNLSLADSVTFDQNSGMTFNGLKLRDVNDVTKVSEVNLVLPIVAGDNVSVTQSNGKILISSTASAGTSVFVNSVEQASVNFTSDPQTQLDNKLELTHGTGGQPDFLDIPSLIVHCRDENGYPVIIIDNRDNDLPRIKNLTIPILQESKSGATQNSLMFGLHTDIEEMPDIVNTSNTWNYLSSKYELRISAGDSNIRLSSPVLVLNGFRSSPTTHVAVLPDMIDWTENKVLATTDLLPIGSVIDFAGSNLPTNYLLCNGQAVSRASYPSLFAVIGTTYGAGDGSTTFNLPSLTGSMSKVIRAK